MSALKHIKNAGSDVAARINPKTTGDFFALIRNIMATFSGALWILRELPVEIPDDVDNWIKWIAIAAGFVATGAHLDKSKK
jgi:hypothetical protein